MILITKSKGEPTHARYESGQPEQMTTIMGTLLCMEVCTVATATTQENYDWHCCKTDLALCKIWLARTHLSLVKVEEVGMMQKAVEMVEGVTMEPHRLQPEQRQVCIASILRCSLSIQTRLGSMSGSYRCCQVRS